MRNNISSLAAVLISLGVACWIVLRDAPRACFQTEGTMPNAPHSPAFPVVFPSQDSICAMQSSNLSTSIGGALGIVSVTVAQAMSDSNMDKSSGVGD